MLPGAQLDAVEHEVVALRAALPRRGFQLVEIFLDDPGEGMLRADPALVALAPFKEREAGDPGEFPFGAVNQIELVAEVQANLARNTKRGVGVRDLFFRGHCYNQVARFRADRFGEFLQPDPRRAFFRAAS